LDSELDSERTMSNSLSDRETKQSGVWDGAQRQLDTSAAHIYIDSLLVQLDFGTCDDWAV